VRIESFRPEFAEAFDDYLLTNPSSLFYSSSKYRHFLTELLGCQDESLLAVEGNTVRGVLPLLSMLGERGTVYNSLPYYGSNGGILADTPALCDGLIQAYNSITDSATTLASTIVDHPFVPQDSSSLRYNVTDRRIGQFTNIGIQADHSEEILARIDSSARRNVNKAVREGVTVHIDHTQFDRLRQLHQDNIRAIGGNPKTDAFFALVPLHFNSGEDYDLYVASRDGIIISALLVFYFNRTVEYFTPAIDSDYRSIQPLSLILLTGMADASRRGFVWWNWGGTWTSQSGVYRFKAKWATSQSTYSYYTQLNDETILNWSPAEILAAYPNFFVVPFSALKPGGAVDE
jgi:hypothetical protein